jgi:hypothetical protein
VDFEAYLILKKIDGIAFQKAEPALYESWRDEFAQMHPNSFTVQKLNIINPIRRKYLLKDNPLPAPPAVDVQQTNQPKLAAQKPIIKPKPKIN